MKRHLRWLGLQLCVMYLLLRMVADWILILAILTQAALIRTGSEPD
jgi:hypothetical protein